MSSDPPTRFRCAALRPSGATDIRIVYATDAAAARERLIAAGLEPVTIEAVGPSLSSRLITRLSDAVWQVRDKDVQLPALSSGSLLRFAYLLASISISLMVGSWALVLVTMWRVDRLQRDEAASIARYQTYRADEEARLLARPAMTAPGPTEIMGRLAVILPSDAGLVAAARDADGALRVELDTSDPDRIRPILAGDPVFRSFKESSQAQTDDGTIRVIWTSSTR